MPWPGISPTHTGSVSPPRDQPGDFTSCGRNSVMGEQRSEGTTAMFPKHLGSRTGRVIRSAKESWRRGVSDGWNHLPEGGEVGTSGERESSDVAAGAWEDSGKNGGAQYHAPVGCGQDWDDTLRGMEAHVKGRIVLCSMWDAVLAGVVFPHPLLSFFVSKKHVSRHLDGCMLV